MTVLILTTSEDTTSDYLLARLAEVGKTAIRFDSDLFPASAAATFHIDGAGESIIFDNGSQTFDTKSIECVIFRRRVRPVPSSDLSREDAQFSFRESLFFLEGLFSCIPDSLWINAYWPTIRAERKPLQLFLAKQVGLEVPSTLVTLDPLRAAQFLDGNPSISKSLSYGIIPGDPPQAIYTNRVDQQDPDLDSVIVCPTLFQFEVPKAHDLRVTWLDNEYVAFRIHADISENEQALDWRRVDIESRYNRDELPEEIAHGIRALMARLGLRYGAIDFVVDQSGRYFFLEVNPAGEWGWLDEHCDGSISEMFQNATR